MLSRNLPGSARKAGGAVRIECLESRRLLSGTVGAAPTAPYGLTPGSNLAPDAFSATPGTNFSGMIGFFQGGTMPAKVTIDWGDGSPLSTATLSPITGAVTAINGSHTYAAAGAYNVWIQGYNADGSDVVDMDPLQALALVGVSSGDTPPLASYDPQLTATAGTQFSGVLATTIVPDNGIVINWGDGTYSTATEVPTGNGSYSIDGSHTYVNPGQYNVGFEIGYAMVGSGVTVFAPTTTMQVNNAAPTGSAFYAVSGSSFSGTVAALPALGSAPQSVTIDWGDGSTSQGNYSLVGGGNAAVAGTHTYATPGNYSVTISAVESAGSSPVTIAQSTAVAVPVFADVPLQTPVAGTPIDGQLGLEVALPYPVASATIDWGDGSQSPVTVTSDQQGSLWYATFAYSGSHYYATPGTYTYNISVTPGGNDAGAPPVIVSTQTAQVSPFLILNATTGQALSGPLATIVALPTAPTSVTIDWGDGTTSVGTYTFVDPGQTGSNAYVSGTHTYSAAGNYTVTVSAVDGDDSTPMVVAVSTANVQNPPATVQAPPANPTPILPFNPTPIFAVSADPVTPVSATSTPTYAANLSTFVMPAPLTANITRNVADEKHASAHTGTVGTPIDADWAAALTGKAATAGLTPTVVIHWADGTKSAGSPGTASASELQASGQHTYNKPGVYRAVAVFVENGKVVRRLAETLKIRKAV